MAVTNFSPLLGLALPTTGDLQGTWGTTVNDSITSLLDTAVAGTTTLSSDLNVTLTTTLGAANQSRSAILLCTGARTGVRTITAPAQSKFYLVINATTGGYAVNFVGAGPTTGVSIANGAKALIAWNGSDFVIVASSVIDFNLGVLGVLPTANGGTGATSLAAATIATYAGSETLSNKTIEAGVFTNGYTEEALVANVATTYTIDLNNGSLQFLTLTDNCTFTFPTPTLGKSLVLVLKQDSVGSRTVSWAASVRWPASTPPTITSTGNASDKFVFTANGSVWLGSVAGQNYNT